MEKSEINVSELCRKLGITGQTLYRYVSQNDELRKDEKNYSKFLNGVFTAFRPSPRIETAFVVHSSIQFLAHAIFNIVIDNKIQLFIGKAIMRGKHFVYFVDDGF